ncbi:hypothetical protein GQ600_9638 [Phytophthora cactorum]|nr:hypothetical protein GQ600_9638 [Phytophthora cactorum]
MVVREAGAFIKHSDGLLSVSSISDEEEIQEVRRMNRTLEKRHHALDPDQQELRARFRRTDSDPGGESDEGQGCRAFQPSATQRHVNRTILQSRFHGKSPLFVLERTQHSGNAPFLRLPPVCTRPMGVRVFRARSHTDALSSSRFMGPKRNPLRSVPAAATRTDVSSALRDLRVFAQEFYIDSITDLVDSTLSFVERYRGIFLTQMQWAEN